MKIIALACLLSFGPVMAGYGLTNKVLIIGIDGVMPSALAVARTPNLNALSSNGCFSVRGVTHPVTHSAACWSSMFTGVWGDKHRVNDPNNSFTGNNFAKYPSFFRRLEAANSNWNTLCFARWSPLLTVVPDADVKTAFSSDAAITTETCQRLTNSNPDVLYMILLDVDSAGHSYGWGPTVTNYVRAIETADGRVGQIMAALNNRAARTNEDWLVIVLTDHGEHDHPDLEKSRITWHIITGAGAAKGVMWPSPSIVDICPTVLTHMGVPIDPAWNLDGRVEGRPLLPARYGMNLIFNGNAEFNSGTDNYSTNRGIAWWFDVSGTTLGVYGANANFPSLAAPGPADRGSNFFLGGTGAGFITQRIDVSDLASDVDGVGVDYILSGWFGGAGTQADSAFLTAKFLNQNGAILGSDMVGNVTPADRGGLTALLQRTAGGGLPSGSRFIEFALTNRVVTGANDSSADNLSFVLVPKPDAAFPIETFTPAGGGWRVGFTGIGQRVYTLERSEDLVTWNEAAFVFVESGGPTFLTDTNAPAARAFYRVICRRP